MAEAVVQGAGRDVRVIGLVGTAHAASHFYQLVLPPLFPFMRDAFGASYAELGLLVTLFYAASGLSQTPSGFLVDRFGARNVLFCGLGLLSTATLLYGLAPSLWLLLPLVVLAGMGNSVFHPADFSILTSSVNPRRMGRAYSVHTLGGSLGYAAAPVTMLTLATLTDWHTALSIVGALGLLVLALLVLNRDLLRDEVTGAVGAGGVRAVAAPAGRSATAAAPAVTTPPGGIRPLLSAPVLSCFVFFAILAFALIGTQAFLPATLYAVHGIPVLVGSSALTVFLLGTASGVLSGGVFADRVSGGHDRIVAFGLSCGGGLLALVGLVGPTGAALFTAVAVAGFLLGTTTPSRDLLVRAAAPKGASGRVFGFVYSGLDIGSAFAPIVIGTLLDRGAGIAVLPLMAVLLLFAVASAMVIKRTTPAAAPA